jgi:hypothetical protein
MIFPFRPGRPIEEPSDLLLSKGKRLSLVKALQIFIPYHTKRFLTAKDMDFRMQGNLLKLYILSEMPNLSA